MCAFYHCASVFENLTMWLALRHPWLCGQNNAFLFVYLEHDNVFDSLVNASFVGYNAVNKGKW